MKSMKMAMELSAKMNLSPCCSRRIDMGQEGLRDTWALIILYVYTIDYSYYYRRIKSRDLLQDHDHDLVPNSLTRW